MLIFLLKGTNIFARKNPPPLYKKTKTGPFRPLLEKEHYLYNLEETTDNTPQGNMEVILATDVEGIFVLLKICCNACVNLLTMFVVGKSSVAGVAFCMVIIMLIPIKLSYS